jgi:peptide/nickel transport system substrate-binding protein
MIYLSNPPLVADLQKSSPVASVPSINSYIYMFNPGHAPFNDVNIRKALLLAVDRDQINKTVLGGVLDTPVGFFPPNYPYSDPSLNFPAQDLTQAQALVDDWIAKKNNGNDLVFTISSSNSSLSVATIQLLQQQWQRIKHVTVKLNVVSTVQVTNDLRAGNFDIVGTTITGVDPEPQYFQSAQTGGARGPVYTGYSDAAVDKAIADSRAAVDPNVRNQALKNFQQALNADPPFMIAYRNPTFYGYKSSLRDLGYFDEGGILSDRFWIKK